ncbi:unnamed protein product, partial [Brassica rapa]
FFIFIFWGPVRSLHLRVLLDGSASNLENVESLNQPGNLLPLFLFVLLSELLDPVL